MPFEGGGVVVAGAKSLACPPRQGQGHGICRSFVFPGTSLTGCLQCELPGPWKEEPCGAEPSSGLMGARERRHSQIPGVLEAGVWDSGIYLEMFLIYFYCQAAPNANVGEERGACNSSITCSLSLMSLLIPVSARVALQGCNCRVDSVIATTR